MTIQETQMVKRPKKKNGESKQNTKSSNRSNGKKRKKRPSEERTIASSSENRKKNTVNKSGNKKKKRKTQQKKSLKKADVRKTSKRGKKKKSNKIITALFDILFFVFILLMLGGAAVFTISEKNDKSFYGYRFYEVYTNSMRKTEDGQKGNFIAGDMIIVKIEDSEKIKVGDIITFVPNQQSPDTYLTHRVIAKEEPEKVEPEVADGKVKTVESYPVFTTQGDANNMADPPVTGDRVIGVVQFAIPKAGKILSLIKNHTIPVIIIIVSFFLLVMLLRQYFAPEEEQGTKKRKNT